MVDTLEQPQPLCPVCQVNPRGPYAGGKCNSCYKRKKRDQETTKELERQKHFSATIPEDILVKVGAAKTVEDWQKIAEQLSPVLQEILRGDIKATAAQASLIKDIMNRAYGKPVATQTERQVSAGIIILPALGAGEHTVICPQCGYDITKETKEKT